MNSKKRRMRCDNDKYPFQKKKNEEYVQVKEKKRTKRGKNKIERKPSNLFGRNKYI